MPVCIPISIFTVSFCFSIMIDGCGSNCQPDMAANGEIRVNQAKRGYDVTGDEQGLIWVNPYVYLVISKGLTC